MAKTSRVEDKPNGDLLGVGELLDQMDAVTVSEETIRNGRQWLAETKKKLSVRQLSSEQMMEILGIMLKNTEFAGSKIEYLGEETISTYGRIQPYAAGLSSIFGKDGSDYCYNVWFERTEKNTWVVKYSRINPKTGNFRS